MRNLKSKCRKMAHLVAFLVACICCGTNVSAQKLIYADDFSTTNQQWALGLYCTQNNSNAIAASYAKVEGGTLKLKANVDCGQDYLRAEAFLNIPLPPEYEVRFKSFKTLGCGGWTMDVWSVFTNEVCCYPLTFLRLGGGGSNYAPMRMFTSLVESNPASTVCGQLAIIQELGDPINSAFTGVWHDYLFVKKHNSINVYVDGVLTWTNSGVTMDGGFLKLIAEQAGSTVEYDDLEIYDLTELSIYTAIELRWNAFSNYCYQIQSSTTVTNWANSGSPIQGTGGVTNFFDSTFGQEKKFFRLSVIPCQP